MPAAYLSERSLIRVFGKDAQHFLQNLITTDVDAIGAAQAFPGALLTPQGKILFDFMIWRDGDESFVLETAAGQADALVARLSMYKLRADLSISSPEQTGVTVHWGDLPPEGAFEDMRFEAADVPVTREPGRHGDHPEAGYHALRILAGVAESGHDFELQDAFPHDVLMDLNHGLAFTKGCYVGQEVVSRMQHRGTARRRVIMVSSEQPLPAAGTEIFAGEKPVATLGSVAGRRGLAIGRIDRIGSAIAAGIQFFAGDSVVTLTLPAWTGLSFATSSEAEA